MQKDMSPWLKAWTTKPNPELHAIAWSAGVIRAKVSKVLPVAVSMMLVGRLSAQCTAPRRRQVELSRQAILLGAKSYVLCFLAVRFANAKYLSRKRPQGRCKGLEIKQSTIQAQILRYTIGSII